MVKEPPAPRAGGERTEQVQEERGGDMGDNGPLSPSPWLPPCLSFPQHPAGGEGHQPPPPPSLQLPRGVRVTPQLLPPPRPAAPPVPQAPAAWLGPPAVPTTPSSLTAAATPASKGRV